MIREVYKIGKAPAIEDKRNIKMAAILGKGLPFPVIFDTDTNLKANLPLAMFGNDEYGDCVIAGRANQTLRFEFFEQKKIVPITTQNVLTEYWYEEGGTGPNYDNGLAMLTSLKIWRKRGWKLSDGNNYTIYAYAQINPKDMNEVKAAIYYLNGIMIGLELPISADDQLQNNQTWDVVAGPDGEAGSWGGHCVYVCGYNAIGPVCVTWAMKQQMTWNFFKTYCDEAYGIIDSPDKWVSNDPINLKVLTTELAAIEKM